MRRPFLTALLVGAASTSLYGLDGRIVQVGFPMSASFDLVQEETAGLQKYRPGCWTPVLVELATDPNAPLFEGRLRLIQRDRDGDLAATEQAVAVRGTRRYWLYTVPQRRDQDEDFQVDVLDSDGNLVALHDQATGQLIEHLRPLAPVVALRNEDYVVLDISVRPVSQLYRIVKSQQQDPTGAPGELLLTRNVVIARQSARELPPHWCGLDVADVILWDAADPSQMTDPVRQLAALIEWTRRGGRLVITAGATGPAVQRSDLARLLPGRLGATTTTQELPELAACLPNMGVLEGDVTICPLLRSSLNAQAGLFYQRDTDSPRVLCGEQTVGRGQIIYLGVTLRDLFRHKADVVDVGLHLLGLRRQTHDEAADAGGFMNVELLSPLARRVGFETRAGYFFLFALLFVVVYILVGTLGAWQWLKKRGWQKYSWPLFAVIVCAASMLSLGAVRVMRGIGINAQELTVVDLRAGDYSATAHGYFGVKTASHTRLDLLLPNDWARIDTAAEPLATLRPLAPDPMQLDASFVVPDLYRLVPTSAQLLDVPFRATLKQFEGEWRGEIGGRITASLTCRKSGSTVYLDNNARITNELGVDLYGCMLLQAMTNPNPEPAFAHRGDRSQLRAFQIRGAGGHFAAGETITDLAKQMYGADGKATIDGLATYHEKWAQRLGARTAEDYSTRDRRQALRVRVEESEAALLLASTFAELTPARDSRFVSDVARTFLNDLDISELLRRDVMVFIGFSDQPGPLRLCERPAGTDRAFSPIRPSETLTMYRVIIPLKLPE